jgi:hypothetical protein
MDQTQVTVKDAQGLMRHSRASTTQDICQQVVSESAAFSGLDSPEAMAFKTGH